MTCCRTGDRDRAGSRPGRKRCRTTPSRRDSRRWRRSPCHRNPPCGACPATPRCAAWQACEIPIRKASIHDSFRSTRSDVLTYGGPRCGEAGGSPARSRHCDRRARSGAADEVRRHGPGATRIREVRTPAADVRVVHEDGARTHVGPALPRVRSTPSRRALVAVPPRSRPPARRSGHHVPCPPGAAVPVLRGASMPRPPEPTCRPPCPAGPAAVGRPRRQPGVSDRICGVACDRTAATS